MANLKEYQIKINGIQESINAVDSLNKQLETLESRIKALEGKAANISSGGGSKSETSEKAKLEEQIAKNAEKIALARTEEYKALLMQKQILKEINNEQKASIAGDKLGDHSYNLNTMAGMKERLRDIKSAMQTTDIDSDLFKQLTKEAGELNSKLKELEQNYGQFGRNVGNYANGVTEGIKNAKQELRELKTEMQNLTVKQDRGIISEEEAERLKSLIPTVKELESSIKDAGKPMDALMDTMQSMVSLAQVGNGFAAFFGIDNDKIERSIQKLVGLQNAMQGLQKLQEQIDTKKGFGKYLSSANDSIDKFVAKITKAKIGVNGLEKSSKTATLAVKGFSTALKATGIGLAVWIGSEVIDGISKFIDNLKAADKAAEEFKQTLDDIADKSLAEGIGARTDIDEYISKIKVASGSTAQEKKIIDELNKSYGDLMGYYYNISDWLTTLNTKRDEYVKLIEQEKRLDELRTLYETTQQAKEKAIETRKQAEAQVSLNHQVSNGITESIAYTSALKAEAIATQQATSAALQYKAELFIINRLRAAIAKEAEEHQQSGSSSTTTTSSDSRVKAEEKIQELTLKLMKDGLAKKLRQLDNDRRKTLERVKGTAEQKLHIEQLYNQLALKEIRDFVDKARSEYSNLVRDIEKEITDLEISAPENVVDQFKYYMAVNEFRHQYLKMESSELLKRKNELTRDADDLYSQLIDIQNEYYQKTVTDQLTLFDGMEEMQKEAALKRKLAAEKEALDEVNIWEEEQRKKVEDLKASIATLEELGNKANEQQKLDLQRAKNQLEGIESGYETMREQKWTNFWERTRQIQQKYETEIKNLDLNNKKERSKIISDFYEAELKKFDDFAQDISDEVSKQPLYIKGWDIINISKTRENFNKIKQELNVALENVQRDFDKLYETYHSDENINNAILSEDDYEVLTSRLKDVERSLLQELELLGSKIKDIGGQWWGTIDKWIQEVGQATSSILSSLSEITSNHYDEMIDKQQKYYDKLSELYDKQKEKTQEYATAVNDIENELSNARGDRRQQLIDQLNAEMAAQRESLAQEKRIEKEKEKAEHRKEELEYQQAVAKKRMDEAQALINGVMAASMAAVNHWPVPALPMIALATATAAAQYAAVRSQYIPKPSTYADGGVIQGKSHRDGGVPVMGGRAEVEGGEFITNKVTTANNTDLLQFINSKRKRVDISDLIDFYSSGKPSKNITGIRTKFADGGQLPLLRNDISMNDRILAAIEDYSNKPTVVQVVDIIDRTQKLNEVKVISGLEV